MRQAVKRESVKGYLIRAPICSINHAVVYTDSFVPFRVFILRLLPSYLSSSRIILLSFVARRWFTRRRPAPVAELLARVVVSVLAVRRRPISARGVRVNAKSLTRQFPESAFVIFPSAVVGTRTLLSCISLWSAALNTWHLRQTQRRQAFHESPLCARRDLLLLAVQPWRKVLPYGGAAGWMRRCAFFSK